jgi:hypothetical protein
MSPHTPLSEPIDPSLPVFLPFSLSTMAADCRMYEAKYPEVDDVVMVMVREREREHRRGR